MIGRFRFPLLGCALLLAAFLLPGIAQAHAHLVHADLAPDSHLQVPAGTVHFWFDEALNPALSQVLIRDAHGAQLNSDTGHVDAANPEELDVQVPPLPAGQYSVIWTSDSAQDGHILHGFYVFSAGGAGAAAISTVSGATIAASAPVLDGTALASAFAHWLVLLTATIWTGALVFEFLILVPARTWSLADAGPLVRRASVSNARVVRFGLLASLLISLVELETQAYAAEGWSGLKSVTVLRDIVRSHYGEFWLVRIGCCVLALLVLSTLSDAQIQARTGNAPVRPAVYTPTLLLRSWQMGLAAICGLGYLLALALSGHADTVSQLLFTSVLLDWLHLLANSVWIGGMSAIALSLISAIVRYSAQDSRRWLSECAAFLTLLKRFSPAAYLALVVAAISGMFNAQVHLSSFSQLFDSAYGRFLLIKLGLIAELMLLSASHVFFTHPRLRALVSRRETGASTLDTYQSLIVRLRIEPLVGALLLLCVALMGQVSPAVTVFSSPVRVVAPVAQGIPTPTPVPDRRISGTAQSGVLAATLTIDPAAVGQARFSVLVKQRGVSVTDGQVRIKLSVPDQPSLGASFVETTPATGGYSGKGDLVQTGQWHADVLIRTRDDPSEFRDVPFDFIVGPEAAFLAKGFNPSSITIRISPGTLALPNTFILSGIDASRVQLLSHSMSMDMGIVSLPGTALGNGRWRVPNAYAPMNGRWGLTVQVQTGSAHTWLTVRQFVFTVPLQGSIRLLTASNESPAAQSTATGAKPTALNTAFNLAFARSLPYTALITEMGSNGVRKLGGTLLQTGLQAHGVDVLDGTPYAYVTNFGATPGTVSQIDVRTMHVVRSFAVGLGPAHVIFTPDHRRAFVTDFRSNDLYVLDLKVGSSRPILFPDGTCFEPHGIDISADGGTLYVACAGGAWIYTVNARTLRPEHTVITGPGAYGVAVDAPRHEVWVTNQTVNNVTVLDARTLKVVSTIPVGKGPALLVVTPDGRRVYVADQLGGQISVIDAASRRVIATLAVAAQPHGPDVTADGKYVYVASIGGNAVTIIRTSDNKVVSIVPSPIGSNEVAIGH